MKRYIPLLALIFGFQLTMMAQKPKSNQTAPKEDIHVNREYDENGNLIKFDSVYSSSWSGDTTLLKSLSPENFPNLFGDHFSLAPDSSFFDDFFFDDFNQSFFSPFSNKKDSIMNQHGSNHLYPYFRFKNDTIASNFKDIDDFFRQFNENKRDSITSKAPRQDQFRSHPKSMDDMMKMLQQQMKEMEELQRKLFKEQQEWKEF